VEKNEKRHFVTAVSTLAILKSLRTRPMVTLAVMALIAILVPLYLQEALFIALIAVIVYLFFVFLSLLHLLFSKVVLTDKTLYYRAGLFDKHPLELSVETIKDAELRQTRLGKIFDYGTIPVYITGSGESLLLLDVKHAEAFLETLLKLINKKHQAK